MKALVISGAIVVMVSLTRGVLAGPTTGPSAAATSAAIAQPDGIPVGDRYVMPALPDIVVDQLPRLEQSGDRYLAERVALADLVIGERILAAEDLANTDAQELPGFAEVLLADGFRQDADGTWVYDPFSSWMRFPLNR
jgi:hypothetical protein